MMKLNVSLKTVIAFFAIMFVFHELHELAHTAVARVQCGCWGPRDFNAWSVCTSCASSVNTLWATLAGPVLTYLLIWIGYSMMSETKTAGTQILGWVLVFSNKPFARIFTVLMRGGDESVLTRGFSGADKLSVIMWIGEIIVVLLLTVPPLIRAFHLLRKNKIAIFTGFMLIPMLVEFALMHKFGNYLLNNGVLNKTGLFGSPILVNVWFGAWLIIAFVFRKYIGHILTSKTRVIDKMFEDENAVVF
jgi:hypothetical protein